MKKPIMIILVLFAAACDNNPCDPWGSQCVQINEYHCISPAEAQAQGWQWDMQQEKWVKP